MSATRDIARPPRDTRLDIVRGWLQLTIFASHVQGSFIGGWMIHAAWGLSDSSEQFVFLSGFTLGSVFARKAARQGWPAATADMLRRTRRLYVTNLIVFTLFGALVILASQFLPDEARNLGWGFLMDRPFRAIPTALTTLYQPDDMGILPVFVWCMLLLPGFAALESWIGDWALLPAALLYAAVRLGLLHTPSLAPETGIGFDPLAWQMIFLLGAWLGRRTLLLGQAWPPSRTLTCLAILIVAAGFVLRLGWYGWLPWPGPEQNSLWVGKETLALPRLLHALALAWLVSVLVPRDAAWMHRAWANTLATIGRFSLQVFCLGLFLSWGAGIVLRSQLWWLDPLLIAIGCLILARYARWLGRRTRHGQGSAPKPPDWDPIKAEP